MRSDMQIKAEIITLVTSKKLQAFPKIGRNNGKNIYPQARLIRLISTLLHSEHLSKFS